VTLRLVAQVLDEQITDCDGENSGRVDGIVLELRENAPPKVAYVEVGPTALFGRLNVRFANWYARYDAKLGPGRGTPFRIPWSRITREGATLRMDLDVESTSINALEDWLRRVIVERIPGCRR
jgi:hypothetical protein